MEHLVVFLTWQRYQSNSLISISLWHSICIEFHMYFCLLDIHDVSVDNSVFYNLMCLCGYLQYFTILELHLKHRVIIMVSISISYRSIRPQNSLPFLSRHEFSFACNTSTKRKCRIIGKEKRSKVSFSLRI